MFVFFFFQAVDGIRDLYVTGVQTCALPIWAGTATASLPASAITANRDSALASLARRRVDIDRHRHRDRTTKARPSFPPGGPRVPALTARAQISVCVPIAA